MSSDPAILFVKPKAIKPEDKKALQAAGVIVVEVPDPHDVKLTRPHAELSGSKLLEIACNAIELSTEATQKRFGLDICKAIIAGPEGA